MPHEFFIVFHIFELSFQVVKTFQSYDLKHLSYLFVYLFIYLKYWEYSL